MKRMTYKELNFTVHRLNVETDSPIKSYDINSKAQIGNYHIYRAYNLVQLHRFTTEGGCIEDVFRCGFMTMRDLYTKIHAFLDGYKAAKQVN